MTDISGNTGAYQPYFSPTPFWFQKIELLMNNVVVDTYYPDCQWIIQQLYQMDEQRKLENASNGPYDNVSFRETLGSASNYYYLNLRTIFNQAHIPLLTTAHYSQLKIYMQNTSKIINYNANFLSGTAVASITACNLIMYVTRLSTAEQQHELANMTKNPMHYRYHSLLYGTFILQSGITNQKNVLSFATGKVSQLHFVVRPTGFSGDGFFNFQPIYSYDLLNSSGTSIIGGTQALSSFNLLEQGKYWSKSTYLTDYINGISNSYVYTWSFAADPIASYMTGADYNSYTFQGNEQLVIYFSSATTQQFQLDVYCLVHSVLEVTPTSMSKINL
jgi:hypothetical protein